MRYLDKALETLQKQGSGTINTDLIETTLQEIGKGYLPGALEWIRINRPQEWARLLKIEATINQIALAQDERGLTMTLSDYRKFFHDMISAYQGKGENLSLF